MVHSDVTFAFGDDKCSAVQCSAVQCSAVPCRAVQCRPVKKYFVLFYKMFCVLLYSMDTTAEGSNT